LRPGLWAPHTSHGRRFTRVYLGGRGGDEIRQTTKTRGRGGGGLSRPEKTRDSFPLTGPSDSGTAPDQTGLQPGGGPNPHSAGGRGPRSKGGRRTRGGGEPNFRDGSREQPGKRVRAVGAWGRSRRWFGAKTGGAGGGPTTIVPAGGGWTFLSATGSRPAKTTGGVARKLVPASVCLRPGWVFCPAGGFGLFSGHPRDVRGGNAVHGGDTPPTIPEGGTAARNPARVPRGPARRLAGDYPAGRPPGTRGVAGGPLPDGIRPPLGTGRGTKTPTGWAGGHVLSSGTPGKGGGEEARAKRRNLAGKAMRDELRVFRGAGSAFCAGGKDPPRRPDRRAGLLALARGPRPRG